MDSQKIYEEFTKAVKGAGRGLAVGAIIGSTRAHYAVPLVTRSQVIRTHLAVFSAFGAANGRVVDYLERKYGMERQNGYLLLLGAFACVLGHKGRNLSMADRLYNANYYGCSLGYTSMVTETQAYVKPYGEKNSTVAGEKSSRAPKV